MWPPIAITKSPFYGVCHSGFSMRVTGCRRQGVPDAPVRLRFKI